MGGSRPAGLSGHGPACQAKLNVRPGRPTWQADLAGRTGLRQPWSASSPGLYSLDVQYFRRTVFPRELGPGGGGTVFPKGIRSAGPKIGPDRIPYDTGNPVRSLECNAVIQCCDNTPLKCPNTPLWWGMLLTP